VAFSSAEYILYMQLIQIGEVREKTVLELIQEMADRQFAEIEQLKRQSQVPQRASSGHRSPRCNSPKRAA
jgi:hypothetical protein